jgi:glycosyltransferase involved in cell wall biosynthesis
MDKNTNKKAILICYQFLTEKGEIAIGGIETYLANLATLLLKNGFIVIITQPGFTNKELSFREVAIKQYRVPRPNKPRKSIGKILFKKINRELHLDKKTDLILFSTETLICKTKFQNVIAIQHGVAWDIPKTGPFFFQQLHNQIRVLIKKHSLSAITHLVCVDYNFPNWYRSFGKEIPCRYDVIYNFAESIPEMGQKSKGSLPRIVFPRRLVTYRGTKIFCEAILLLHRMNVQASFTFAGTGPDIDYLQDHFKNDQSVTFTKYHPGNAVAFLSSYDIVVIPTIGSEGSSLSAIEAMSAGCAIVATGVGGLTNIIVSNYNGLLIKPNSPAELAKSLKTLIQSPTLTSMLASKAKETFETSFTKRTWDESWLNVISSLSNKENNE